MNSNVSGNNTCNENRMKASGQITQRHNYDDEFYGRGNRNKSRGLMKVEDSSSTMVLSSSLAIFAVWTLNNVDAPKPSDSLFDSLAFDLFFGCSWDSGERIFVLLKLRSFEKPQLDSQNVEKCRRVIDVWMLAKNMKAAMGVIFEN